MEVSSGRFKCHGIAGAVKSSTHQDVFICFQALLKASPSSQEVLTCVSQAEDLRGALKKRAAQVVAPLSRTLLETIHLPCDMP